MIYTVRTTVGRENSVLYNLSNKISIVKADVKAILKPGELKGYIFVEGEISEIEKSVAGLPHVRGIIKKEIKIAELTKFLETKKSEIKINRGDVVKIVGGPFKNEKGKITRVDDAKEEVTVELLEAAIPIPITVSVDSVRVLEEKKSGEE